VNMGDGHDESREEDHETARLPAPFVRCESHVSDLRASSTKTFRRCLFPDKRWVPNNCTTTESSPKSPRLPILQYAYQLSVRS
jgi:hypothetical protein